jgi:hypothetical protein
MENSMKSTPVPHFEPSQFTPTKFDTAQDKADFANRLVRLIAGGFKPTLFSHKLYHDLALSFGFIAHYDRDGFYASQLSTLPRRISFLHTLYQGGIYGTGPGPHPGDPRFTRSDVEASFRHLPWIEVQVERLEADLAQLAEAGEQADLHRLIDRHPGAAQAYLDSLAHRSIPDDGFDRLDADLASAPRL